jgi:hypothetical protein
MVCALVLDINLLHSPLDRVVKTPHEDVAGVIALDAHRWHRIRFDIDFELFISRTTHHVSMPFWFSEKGRTSRHEKSQKETREDIFGCMLMYFVTDEL